MSAHRSSPPPRSPDSGLTPKELAHAKLRARATRIARMRKRVVAASLATFALAFGAIAYDGSMGSTTSASSGTQTSASASSSGNTTTSSGNTTTQSVNPTNLSDNPTSSSDDTTTSGSSSSDDSAGSPSAVTTRQS